MYLRYRGVDPLDADRADDVAVAVRLENVGLAERGHPVDQHAARHGIDDPVLQPGFMAGAAGDYIAALLDKEIGPVLEPVFVDAIDIGGDQLVHPEPDGDIVHRAPLSRVRRRSVRGIPSRSRGSRLRWRGRAAARH